jgi:hypothetical protein
MVIPCNHCGKEIKTSNLPHRDATYWCRECCIENMQTLLSQKWVWTVGCRDMIDTHGYTWWRSDRAIVDAIPTKYPLCSQCGRFHS